MSRTKRVKKVVPPPRDPRLVAIAEQAQRVGWKVDWQLTGGETPWLRVSNNGVAVDAFSGEELNCYGHYYAWAGAQPARTPAEALRSAYAALGVAIDQAEDAFGGAP